MPKTKRLVHVQNQDYLDYDEQRRIRTEFNDGEGPQYLEPDYGKNGEPVAVDLLFK